MSYIYIYIYIYDISSLRVKMFNYIILFFAYGFLVVRHTLVPCFKFVIGLNLPVPAGNS